MSTIQTNAIVDAAGGNTATVNGISPLANSARFARNFIINGDMKVAQRGTSVTGINKSGYILWTDLFALVWHINSSQQTTALGTAPD